MRQPRRLLKVGIGLLSLFMVVRFMPFPKTFNAPDWYLVTCANDIIRRYGSVFSHCKIITDETGGKVLKIYYKATPSTIKKANEIDAIFDCFLFLMGRDGGEQFSAISCEYKRGVIYEIDYTTIEITQDTFQKLYQDLDDGTSSTQFVQKLATRWQDITHYNRPFLEYSNTNEYRSFLITNWGHKTTCPENESYYLYYSHLIPQNLSINIIDGSIRSIANVPVPTSKYVYAAWGAHKDIWVYGDFGLLHYKYSPGETWVLSDEQQLDTIPEALQKVLELSPITCSLEGKDF